METDGFRICYHTRSLSRDAAQGESIDGCKQSEVLSCLGYRLPFSRFYKNHSHKPQRPIPNKNNSMFPLATF